MRSFVYQCEGCGQIFNDPRDKTHRVPHLNVRKLDVHFAHVGANTPIGAQGPNSDRYAIGKWVGKATKANVAEVGERHFCSGKCLGG